MPRGNGADWRELHPTSKRNLLSAELAYGGGCASPSHIEHLQAQSFQMHFQLLSVKSHSSGSCPPKHKLTGSSPDVRKDSPDFPSFLKVSVVLVTCGLFAVHF